MKFNCAAIPTGLLESELFGHKRILLAQLRRKLDGSNSQIREPCSWMKLAIFHRNCNLNCCAFSRSRNSERLGGTRTIRVDARFVVATNRDLNKMVAQREFRRTCFTGSIFFPFRCLRYVSELVTFLCWSTSS